MRNFCLGRSRPWIAHFFLAPVLLLAQNPTALHSSSVIGAGWYPWYEIQMDPEAPENLVVCGTKWDADKNQPFGFVHTSADSGLSWRLTLEDRSSEWVTEHSCAFGPKHRAYFISEASWVVDGRANHRRGTTRLYVSTDAGVHWTESLETGWADHSTSAVDLKSGKLYTFYNSPATIEAGREQGSSIGVLVFSPDGSNVAGPFFNPGIESAGYQGVYPSAALAMKNGDVVALYRGLLPQGKSADLGVVRAQTGSIPSLDFTLIAHAPLDQGCPYLDKGSLAYDPARNRLFVLYGDGCTGRRLLLTMSDDGGRTWAKSSVVSTVAGSRTITNPSLAIGSMGALFILWEDGQSTGNWFISSIEHEKLLEPATTLTRDLNVHEIRSDALYTRISQLDEYEPEEGVSEPSVRVSVVNMRNNVWRANGLVRSGENLIAVWPSSNRDGMELDSALLHLSGSGQAKMGPEENRFIESTPSESVLVLYGGSQQFDHVTSTLQLCLKLVNRGSLPLHVPIKLQVTQIRPETGISIINSDNHQTGIGAIWDISHSVTGDRIPPGSTSNPFCLDFHLKPGSHPIPDLEREVLSLGLNVVTGTFGCPAQNCEPERPARAGALGFNTHSSASYASAVMSGP